MELETADPATMGPRARRLLRTMASVVVGVVLASACLTGSASSSFVVSPMEEHLSVPAGERGSASLSIRNTGDRALSLRLYLADSVFGPDGREQDVELGVLERSCAPWVDLESDLLDLVPGEMRQIKLAVSSPKGAAGSFWAKLYIEEMSVPDPIVEEQAGRRYQVFMRQRMGVRIFLDVPGTAAPGLIVTNLQVDPRASDSTTAILSAENTGNALLRCTGWFELRTSRGDLVTTVRPGGDGRFLIFPGASRDISATLPGELPADTYTILAIVDYGGENLIAGEQILSIGDRGRRPSGVAGGTP